MVMLLIVVRIDDAGSACRGAINMRIARLNMDPQDKLRFEIHGKSSVKYHLKANHQVEAKRWFWALNNAIQWSKDEAREEERRHRQESDALKQAKIEQLDKHVKDADTSSVTSSMQGHKHLVPSTALGIPTTSSAASRAGTSVVEDEDFANSTYESSVAGGDMRKIVSHLGTTTVEGDVDDEEEYGDDASSHEVQPANKDAFNITAQSAKLQLELLAQVSGALQMERSRNPTMSISDPVATQALASYEAAVSNLKGLIGDLLRISRDRDAYWQFRLDREADVRRMWEESMAKVAREQEELENRIGESELKRRKTKRALREALESFTMDESQQFGQEDQLSSSNTENIIKDNAGDDETPVLKAQRDISSPMRRKSTFIEMPNLEDSDSEEEEFFDAVGAGEVEVVEMPVASPSLETTEMPASTEHLLEDRQADIQKSFKGYEDEPRKRLKMDADDRPKISLWVSPTLSLSPSQTNSNTTLGNFEINDRQGHDKNDIACFIQ
jgi:oxysterol-binding protein 1